MASDVAIKVTFLGELRSLVRRREVEVTLTEGSTVRALMENLRESFREAFDGRVFDEKGDIYRHVSIFVNGKSLDKAIGLDTKFDGGEEVDVLILPVFEGG